MALDEDSTEAGAMFMPLSEFTSECTPNVRQEACVMNHKLCGGIATMEMYPLFQEEEFEQGEEFDKEF